MEYFNHKLAKMAVKIDFRKRWGLQLELEIRQGNLFKNKMN